MLPALAFVQFRDEADILPAFMRHMEREGIAVFGIDNWSSDDGDIIMRASPACVGCLQWPSEPQPANDHLAFLRYLEELVQSIPAHWRMNVDADEFFHSDRADRPLVEALTRVSDEGYNAVEFALSEYWPTDDLFQLGDDPEQHFHYRRINPIGGHLRHTKAWCYDGPISLVKSGGHSTQFEGRKIYPRSMVLRHYPFRTSQQYAAKMARHSLRVRDAFAESQGWHRQYENIPPVPVDAQEGVRMKWIEEALVEA